jgi:hypothetical protein
MCASVLTGLGAVKIDAPKEYHSPGAWVGVCEEQTVVVAVESWRDSAALQVRCTSILGDLVHLNRARQ